MLTLLAPAGAYAAGGAYVVDDAEVGKPGECQLESWIALATNHDLQAMTQPACVANLGVPVELGGAFARTRMGDVWQSSGGPKTKVNILPVETGRIGIGLGSQAAWDLASGDYLFHIFYVPLTFQWSEQFRVNVNAGWQYDGPTQLSYLFWGAGFEWEFAKPLTLIGEVFGFAGPTADPATTTEPRAQIGLRLSASDNADFDLIYGYNVGGENAHWLTLGVNLRF